MDSFSVKLKIFNNRISSLLIDQRSDHRKCQGSTREEPKKVPEKCQRKCQRNTLESTIESTRVRTRESAKEVPGTFACIDFYRARF